MKKTKKKNDILEFSCTGCGLCCKENGYIYFSLEDIKKASDYLNMNPLVFISKYLKHSYSLEYHIKVDKENKCPFLNENNRCIINDAKPKQCRTFPYWNEYTDKNGNLISGKFNRPCPGVKVKKKNNMNFIKK